MKKLLPKILIGLAVLIVCLFVFRNVVIKGAIEHGVTFVTGFKTEVGKFKITLPATIEIRDLRIHNPEGFENKYFANLPEIFIHFEPGPLLKKEKIHLPEVRLDIAEINIEKTKDGHSNLEQMTSIAKAEGKEPKAKEKKEGEALPFELNRLELTIRKVSYRDDAALVPQNVSTDLNVDKEVIENITDPFTLVNLIMMKALYGTTFGNLLNVDLGGLQDSVNANLAKGKEAVAAHADKLQGQASDLAKSAVDAEAWKKTGSKTTEAASKTLDDSKQKVSDAAGAAKEKLSGLFGGKE